MSSQNLSIPVLKISPLPHFVASRSELPSYQTPGSVGMDVRACFENENDIFVINPGERKCVPTGLRVEIPEGYELQGRPRSGISLRTNLLMVNSPSTLDQDFRGETHVILGNFGDKPHEIRHGERIAQWVMAPIVRPKIEIVETLSETSRGSGGFGSTGGFRFPSQTSNKLNFIV